MDTLRVRGEAPEPEILAEAATLLWRGELLIYPTDTLYALGGRALDPRVAQRVRAAKAREPQKPLPLVAGSLRQALELCSSWPPSAEILATRFWPGPLTLVLPAARGLPPEVTAGSGSVALRVPALAVTRALCALGGPLISTSANVAGAPPPLTCGEAAAGVGAFAALALDAGPGRREASTIADLTGGSPRPLRVGAVTWMEIEAALGIPSSC